jgi:hypothetical protein
MNLKLEKTIIAQEINGFDEIQAGHWVCVTSGGVYSHNVFREVDRVTNTQIIIGDSKYSRMNGYKIGDTSKFGKERIDIDNIEHAIKSIKFAKIKSMSRAIDTQLQNIAAVGKEANDGQINELLAVLHTAQAIINKL